MKWKWNKSGFRLLLCTYRLNWARTTSWGWWDEWDDTVLQTQNSKFKPWRYEVEYATSRSRRLPTILSFRNGWKRSIFVSFKTLAWKTAVLPTTLLPPPTAVMNRMSFPSRFSEPPLDSQGGGGAGVFVAGKLFISTGFGGALKISHFVTCLYVTVLEVNCLFHAESARN